MQLKIAINNPNKDDSKKTVKFDLTVFNLIIQGLVNKNKQIVKQKYDNTSLEIEFTKPRFVKYNELIIQKNNSTFLFLVNFLSISDKIKLEKNKHSAFAKNNNRTDLIPTIFQIIK